MPSGGARKGAGRKPVPRAAVQIRMSPEDYGALKKAAEEVGLKPSTMARKIILAHLYAAAR